MRDIDLSPLSMILRENRARFPLGRTSTPRGCMSFIDEIMSFIRLSETRHPPGSLSFIRLITNMVPLGLRVPHIMKDMIPLELGVFHSHQAFAQMGNRSGREGQVSLVELCDSLRQGDFKGMRDVSWVCRLPRGEGGCA